MKQATNAKPGLPLIAPALATVAATPALRAETATWIGNGNWGRW